MSFPRYDTENLPYWTSLAAVMKYQPGYATEVRKEIPVAGCEHVQHTETQMSAVSGLAARCHACVMRHICLQQLTNEATVHLPVLRNKCFAG